MNKILRTLLLSSSLGIFIHCHENPIVKILDGSFMPVLQIKTVIPVDENKLKVQYQVPVEASSATVPGNYTLVDSNGSDVSITTSEQDIDDPTKIYLTTGDLSVSPTYSLIIRYVTANKGFAPIPEAGTTFEFDAFIRPANPLPPYKVRPLNNQQTSWNVTLEWYPGFGANSYQLKIATDINMTAILVNSTFDSAVTEYQFTASDDITHYWTVVADVSIYPPEPWSFAPLSSVYVWGDSPSSLPPIGTKDRPITTISGGLGSAVALGLADVNVSAIAAQYDESLVMPTGINLYGGFDAAAGWNRSLPTQANLWTGNETRVQATTAIAITLSALYDPAVIEGFTISTTTTGTTYLAYVVLTGNNVELRHNQLYFGGCTEDCYGIFANEGVNIVLQNNDIIGAVNTGTGENYGIHCFKCGMTIDGNTIEAGGTINDPSNSYGIYLDESNPSVTNNTIWGGNAFTKSYGMMIDFSSAPIIMGNTITGGSGESSYGIYVQNLSTPDISSGNVISGGDATIGSLGLYVNSQNLTVMGNTINGGTEIPIYRSIVYEIKGNFETPACVTTLIWDAPVDLDLHVKSPNKQHVFFSSTHKDLISGGFMELDVDNIIGYGPENVILMGPLKSGFYEIYVNYYNNSNNYITPVNASIYLWCCGEYIACGNTTFNPDQIYKNTDKSDPDKSYQFPEPLLVISDDGC